MPDATQVRTVTLVTESGHTFELRYTPQAVANGLATLAKTEPIAHRRKARQALTAEQSPEPATLMAA